MPKTSQLLCQDVETDLSDAEVDTLPSWTHYLPEKQEGREKQAAAGAHRCPRRGSSCLLCLPKWPARLADVGGERLPVLVPCGCHADPQAVFADVVFDFTRLELQLCHFSTQGCHDSWPHVPWVAHTLGEGEGPAGTPRKPQLRSPLKGGARNVGLRST